MLTTFNQIYFRSDGSSLRDSASATRYEALPRNTMFLRLPPAEHRALLNPMVEAIPIVSLLRRALATRKKFIIIPLIFCTLAMKKENTTVIIQTDTVIN